MKLEKIVLDEARHVSMQALLNHWTTAAFGSFPKRGAVIVCPGGAFMVHAGGEGEPIALAFAGAGYQVFLLKYGIGKNAVMPNPIRDAALAVAYLRDHAEELELDPDKIALCGFSAGGYVAAALGTMYTRPDILAAVGRTAEEIRPNALILGYPLTTVEAIRNQVTVLLSGDRIDEALFQTFSPVAYVGPHTPPTFLWNIYADTMIPVETGLDFCAALAKADVPFELHTFQEGSHGSGLGTSVTSLGETDLENPQIAQWFGLCLGWLKNLFGSPRLPKEAVIGFQMPKGERAHPGQSNLPESLL